MPQIKLLSARPELALPVATRTQGWEPCVLASEQDLTGSMALNRRSSLAPPEELSGGRVCVSRPRRQAPGGGPCPCPVPLPSATSQAGGGAAEARPGAIPSPAG